MNPRSLRLQIVILAAGFSSRLGFAKALARIHGKTLLGRALKTAQRLDAAAIIVVVPPNCVQYRIAGRGIRVRWAANPRRSEGLASSVRRGITAARHSPAILLLPVDLADLRARELVRLISRWQSAPRRVIARRVEGGAAIPLILPRWLYPVALRVTGDRGLRELIGRLTPDQRALVELPSAADDIDTPHALNAARRRFALRD